MIIDQGWGQDSISLEETSHGYSDHWVYIMQVKGRAQNPSPSPTREQEADPSMAQQGRIKKKEKEQKKGIKGK